MLDAPSHPKPTNLDIWLDKKLSFSLSWTFFSLTMEGSTDDSVTEQETVFLRTCMEGKIVNRFVCIGEPKSTGSADLFAFVQDKLNDNFLSNHMSKFVGFASVLPSIVREKNFILDKISFSFSFSVVDINSMKRVAAVFVVGSKNYKVSTIIDHERSNMHVRAVGITKSKEQALTQTTTAHKTVIALIEPKLCINHWKVLYKLCVFYVDRNSKMTTTAGHSFYIGPIGYVREY
jgi:hypothetical protein